MCKIQNTSTLILVLTRNCQLNCKYCKMQRKKNDLTEDDMYKAIELLLTSKQKKLELQFFGGEPLLRYDLIKKGILYAEKLEKNKNKNLYFTITTNGISLNEEMLNFFSNHKVKLMFSLDGIKESNHRNRITYKNDDQIYCKIVNNISLTDKLSIPYFINMTISPVNVSTMFEDFKYLTDLNFRKFQIVYSVGVYWDEKKKSQFMSNNSC